ncbi:MAG: hypothetical protein LBL98_08895 [Ruminococcus sp.]|jgi:hypothetical protein|nr:hypothetical protein [Ruminococcus sp.]
MKTAKLISITFAVIILVIYTVFYTDTEVVAEPAVPVIKISPVTEKDTYVKSGQAEYYYNTFYTALREKSEKPITFKIPEPVYEEFEVPYHNSDFKAYMSFKKITDKTAPQWHYRQNAWTDSNGLRRVGDDYLVAMGTYYTENVGERFRITLDTGNVFTVTIGDIKNPAHTDRYNMYTSVKDNYGNFYSANVIEFIVDTDKLDSYAKKLGTVSCLDGLDGNIEKVEKIVGNKTKETA